MTNPIGFIEGRDIILPADQTYLSIFRVGDVVVVQHRNRLGDLIDVFRLPYSTLAGISETVGTFGVRASREGDEATGEAGFFISDNMGLTVYIKGGWVTLSHHQENPRSLRVFDRIRLSPNNAAEVDERLTDLKDAITTGLQSGDIDPSEH